jgi:hypothetical protein
MGFVTHIRAAGLALALTTVAAGSAHAAAAPSLLTVRTVRVATADAPLAVTARVPSDATVRLRVNGRLVPDAFGTSPTTARRAELSASTGLRAGRNQLVVTATMPDGRRDTERRTVTLRRSHLMADAGRDRTVHVGTARRLGAPGLRAAPGVAHRWRIVARPRGSHPVLRHATTDRPVLRTDESGTYRLRLVSRDRAGRVSRDAVTVYATPDDPPAGVRIETLADRADGRVRIDGQPLDGSQGRDGLTITVIERATRHVVSSGTWPLDATAGEALRWIAGQYKGYTDHLVILSGFQGVPDTLFGALNEMLTSIGGQALTGDQQASLRGGVPFSVLGVSGAPAGSAWVSIPTRRDQIAAGALPAAGNLTGWLRLTPATERYDLAVDDFPAFDTHAAGAGPRQNRTVVRGAVRTVTLPADHQAGFHLLALDAVTLTPIFEDIVGTDAPNGTADRDARAAQARALDDRLKGVLRMPGRPILIMQSIGLVDGQTQAWGELAKTVERFGGNPHVFNALRGDSMYTLVGRRGDLSGAVESTDPAGLRGLLGRTRADGFAPLLADPTGASNTELVQVVNQAPRGFPAFASAGERAAAAALGDKLDLCDAPATCDVRAEYWRSYRTSWDVKISRLARAKYTSFDDPSFTEDEFNAVKKQLLTEITAVSNVRTFFDELGKPFGYGDVQALLDVDAIADRLFAAVQPPKPDNTTAYWLNLSSKIVAVAGVVAVVFPPAGAAIGGVSAGLSLAGYLTTKTGGVVGGDIRTTAGAFKQTVLDRLRDAQSQIQNMAVLIVSDWGRLQTVSSRIADRAPGWTIQPTSAAAQNALRLALQRWMAETLVPVAYPNLTVAWTWGGQDVRQFPCGGRKLWPGVASNMQPQFIDAFDANGAPQWDPYFLFRGGASDTPAGLGEFLFNAPDAATPGLGLVPRDFFSLRLYRKKWIAYPSTGGSCGMFAYGEGVDGWPD